MLTTEITATMTSRGAEDKNASQKMAEEFFPRVSPDIAAMSREEMAMLLQGMAAKISLIEREWKFRKSYSADVSPAHPCISVMRIYAALEDYRQVAFFEDCREQLYTLSARRAVAGGCVYVAEFSDGHIKIGHSITPEARLRSLAGGNQASMLRHWISGRIDSAVKVEKVAHRHFKKSRVGGEFFKVDFTEAVEWVGNEFDKQLAKREASNG